MSTLESLQHDYQVLLQQLGNLRLQTMIEEQKLLTQLAILEQQAQDIKAEQDKAASPPEKE